jgi:hypothetical protein
MQAAEARPPYVSFEVRPVEDRAASIEAGHYKTRDEDFAIITPQGSKDRTERVAREWFVQMEEQVQQQRMPAEWFRQFKGAFEMWKAGKELPLNGTPILTWPVLSPSQVRSCIDAQVRTVEDLAAANEETIARIGMGGRSLKDKAIAWLDTAKGSGKVTEEMAALRASLADANARNDKLQEQLTALAAQVAANTKK